MSFSAEIKDFINTSLAVAKHFRESADSRSKSNYYNRIAGIKQQTANTAAWRAAASIKAQNDRNRIAADTNRIRSERAKKYGERIDAQNTYTRDRMENPGKYRAAPKQAIPVDKDVEDFFKQRPDGAESPIPAPGEPAPSSPAPARALPVPDKPAAPSAPAPSKPVTALPVPPTSMAAYNGAGDSGAGDDPDAENNSEDPDDPDENVDAYAEGGVVDEQPEEAIPTGAIPTEAIPTTRTAAASPQTAPQAAPQKPSESNSTRNDYGFDASEVIKRWSTGIGGPALPMTQGIPVTPEPERPKNPVAVGLKAIQDEIVAEQRSVGIPVNPGPSRTVQALAQNAGAASDAEVKQIDKIVDPENQLTQSAKVMAWLDSGVTLFLSRGEPEKAAKFAKSLLLYGKRESEKYGSLAVVALQNKDIERARKYIERAYDYVPNGKELVTSIEGGRLRAQLKDSISGDVQDLGAFDAPQVFKFALGVANGQEYVRQLIEVASGRGWEAQAKQAAAREAKPRDGASLRDRAAALEAVEGPLKYDDDTPAPIKKYLEASEDKIKSIAAEIYRQGASRDTARRLSIELFDPTKDGNFKFVKSAADGGVVVHSKHGHKFTLHRNAVADITRTRQLKAENDAKAEAEAAIRAKLTRERDAAEQKMRAKNQEAVRAVNEANRNKNLPPPGGLDWRRNQAIPTR